MDNSFAYFSNSKLASVRIIALEDDITIGSLLNAMLGELYTFEHVTTIKAFQQRFVSLQPDIVLLDLNLPDGKGIDLCKTIRTGSINKEVVVIIMTGDASQTTVNEAYSAGATDYIRKPFFPEELLAKIRILAENTVSKRNLKQLYDGVKLFNKKLYKLTAIINSNINEIGKTDIISSIEDVLNILDSQYFEIVLFATPSNHIFQTSKSPNTKFISYDKLLELKPKFKKSNVVNTSLKIKNKKYTIHLYYFRILFNNHHSGSLILESTRPLPSESIDMLKLYLDFINLKGSDIDIKNKLKYEIDKERKEISKVRTIQVSLLPDFKDIPGFDIASTFIPMEEISGDFFDGFYINEHIYQIVVCDVCGHGMASSYVGSSIRSIIRSISLELESPASICDTLNKLLTQTSRDLSYFATMFLWQVDFLKNEITYVSTGHPSSLFYQAKTDKVLMLGQTGPLIGLFEDATFKEEKISFNQNDIVFVYTDGLIEAPHIDTRELFGNNRLLEQFKHAILHDMPLDIVHSILGSVYSFMDYGAVDDDVTIICMKKR